MVCCVHMAPSPGAPNLDELLVHAGWLRRLASQLVADEASAEDLIQDTWVVALERPRRPGVPLGPWLAKVLRNRAVNLARSGLRRERREQDSSRSEELPPVDELSARAEGSRELVSHVLELPEAQREVLILRYYEGLETARIAQLLGLTEGAVRSRLSRGHGLLRERLDSSRDGDRAAWMAALAPLTLPATTPLPAISLGSGFLGGLLVSTTTHLTLGGRLLVLSLIHI